MASVPAPFISASQIILDRLQLIPDPIHNSLHSFAVGDEPMRRERRLVVSLLGDLDDGPLGTVVGDEGVIEVYI